MSHLTVGFGAAGITFRRVGAGRLCYILILATPVTNVNPLGYFFLQHWEVAKNKEQ